MKLLKTIPFNNNYDRFTSPFLFAVRLRNTLTPFHGIGVKKAFSFFSIIRCTYVYKIYYYFSWTHSPNMICLLLYVSTNIQARIAQLVAYRLGTGEVLGSNPGKGENFSMKISNWLNLNLNWTAKNLGSMQIVDHGRPWSRIYEEM